jgi:hypothetical protein
MKRWTILVGRGGTILLAIGSALFLVSLVPATQLGSFMGSGPVYSKTFLTYSLKVLTPQQGLRMTGTANGTLNVYVLEVDSRYLEGWISEHFSESIDDFFGMINVTRLEEFLEMYPNSVAWKGEILNGKIEFEYVPTKITNATLVFSNLSTDFIQVEYEGTKISLVAPRKRVLSLAQWMIPIGFVFTLPWLADLRSDRRHLRLQLA